MKKKKNLKELNAENILQLEIKEVLKKFQKINGIDLNEKSIQNSKNLVQKFLYKNERPHVEIDNVEILYQTVLDSVIAIIPKKKYYSGLSLEENEIKNRFTLLICHKCVPGDKVKLKLLKHHSNWSEVELI